MIAPNTLQQWLWEFILNQPITIFFVLITIFVIYKTVTFTEVVIVSTSIFAKVTSFDY